MPGWAHPVGRDDCREHPHRGRNGQQFFGGALSDSGTCCTVRANRPAISANCGWVPDAPGIVRGRITAGRVLAAGSPPRHGRPPGQAPEDRRSLPLAKHAPAEGGDRGASHPRLHLLHEGTLDTDPRRRDDVVAFAGHCLIRLLRLGPQVAEAG